jgi:RNA polymerase-binding protein DksA
LRAVLEARRAQLRREIDARLTRIRESASDPETAKEGESDETCDVDVQVLELSTSTLRRIEAALERLDRGAYGRCKQCGRPISATRLNAMPFAARCHGCEHERERAAVGGRRVVRRRPWELHEALNG